MVNRSKLSVIISSPGPFSDTVSGIVSVVSLIERCEQFLFVHYYTSNFSGLRIVYTVKWLYNILRLPFYIKMVSGSIYHQNVPFDRKGLFREAVISFVVSHFARIPIVLHLHGGRYLHSGNYGYFLKMLANFIFRKSKAIIVLSNSEQNIVKEYFGFNSYVVPNAIDQSVLTLKRRRFPVKIPRLLFMGRITKEKGVFELFNCVKLLYKSHPFDFVICGDGDAKEEVVELFSDLMGASFEYKGVVFGDEKDEVLKSCDIFILPSYFEGLPMALLEAMAVGLIPIVTNVGAISSVVQNGQTGYFFNDIRNPRTMANDIYRVLTLSDAEKNEVLTRASAFVHSNFGLSDYLKNIADIYHSLY